MWTVPEGTNEGAWCTIGIPRCGRAGAIQAGSGRWARRPRSSIEKSRRARDTSRQAFVPAEGRQGRPRDRRRARYTRTPSRSARDAGTGGVWPPTANSSSRCMTGLGRGFRGLRPRQGTYRATSDAGTDVFGGVQFGVGTRTCKKRRVIWGVHLSGRTPSPRAGWCRFGHPEVRASPTVLTYVGFRSRQAADARPSGVPGAVVLLTIGEPIQPFQEVAQGVDPPRSLRGVG